MKDKGSAYADEQAKGLRQNGRSVDQPSLDTLDSVVGGKRRCHTAHRHADMKRDGWKCCVNCGMDFYAANDKAQEED